MLIKQASGVCISTKLKPRGFNKMYVQPHKFVKSLHS